MQEDRRPETKTAHASLGTLISQSRPAQAGPVTFTVGYLLGQHVTQLLLAEANLVDGLSSVFEGDVVAVEVRGEKYLYK